MPFYHSVGRGLLCDCENVAGGSLAALVSREPLEPPAASNNPAGGRSQAAAAPAPGQGEGGAWIHQHTSFCFVLLHHLIVELTLTAPHQLQWQCQSIVFKAQQQPSKQLFSMDD